EARNDIPQLSLRCYLGSLIRESGARGVLVQILGASVILQLIGLTIPLLTKVLVDQVIPLQIASAMTMIGATLIFLVLALMVTSYMRGSFLIYLQGCLDSRITLGFFEHMVSLPFRFFQLRSTGDLLARVASNAAIRETLTHRTVSAVLDGVFILMYL